VVGAWLDGGWREDPLANVLQSPTLTWTSGIPILIVWPFLTRVDKTFGKNKHQKIQSTKAI